MHKDDQRRSVRFRGQRAECVARHYPGTTGACAVVMAGGFAHEQAVQAQLAFLDRHLGPGSELAKERPPLASAVDPAADRERISGGRT